MIHGPITSFSSLSTPSLPATSAAMTPLISNNSLNPNDNELLQQHRPCPRLLAERPAAPIARRQSVCGNETGIRENVPGPARISRSGPPSILLRPQHHRSPRHQPLDLLGPGNRRNRPRALDFSPPWQDEPRDVDSPLLPVRPGQRPDTVDNLPRVLIRIHLQDIPHHLGRLRGNERLRLLHQP